MIPVLKVVQSLRYASKDMQASNYSDFELIEVINQAVSLLYSQMSESYVTFGVKRKLLTVDDSKAISLPADFVRVHQVGMGDDGVAVSTSYMPTCEGTFRIINDTFYAMPGTYGLEYYYVPARITKLSDQIDAPLSISPYIEQVALALLGNNLEKAQAVVALCSKGLKAQEISHYQNVGPVQVLGGRI